MAKHMQITGRVQGVGYRASFAAQARSLGLCGWVRNRRDGSVEALVRGPAPMLEELLTWARRGPPLAQVQEIKIAELDDDAVDHKPFEIEATA